MFVTFSLNGRIVAFVRDNNLFLKKLDFDTESQITKDGKKNELINGIADWVYEEEFANVQYFQFSPDNKLLAFVKFYKKDVSAGRPPELDRPPEPRRPLCRDDPRAQADPYAATTFVP